MVKGTLSHIIPGKGVAIQTLGSSFPAAWNNGHEGYGELTIVSKFSDAELEAGDLNTHLYRKIAVVGHLSEVDLLNKLVETEIAGLICGTVTPDVFQMAATINVPVALTDGVGSGGIYSKIFDILSQNNGNHTAIYNQDFNILGRPVVVIVNPDLEPENVERPQSSSGIKLKRGHRVRLITGNNRGVEGVVEKVHAWPQATLNGTRHMGADVKFGDDESVFVPTVNLDIIL
ncbi:MAG: hypothetical protein AAGD96_09665 [Chloroflexota bacterium]